MFQSCPNCPALKGLKRIICFLASHPSWPLVYARNNSLADMKILWSKDQSDDKINLSKNLEKISDSRFSSINIDKSSYVACTHMYNSTSFAWKTTHFIFACLHPTDIEVCIFYFAAILTMQYCLLLQSIGLP